LPDLAHKLSDSYVVLSNWRISRGSSSRVLSSVRRYWGIGSIPRNSLVCSMHFVRAIHRVVLVLRTVGVSHLSSMSLCNVISPIWDSFGRSVERSIGFRHHVVANV
jgi:hypothetical protein